MLPVRGYGARKKGLYERDVRHKGNTPNSTATHRPRQVCFLHGGGGNVRLGEREEGQKGKKKKERKQKETVMTSTPEGKRKDVSSPEAQPPTGNFHFMPSSIPLYKARKT